MNNQIKKLSIEELVSIKKELRSNYITSFLICTMILTIIHLYIFLSFDSWLLPDFGVLLDLGMLTIVFLLTRLLSNNIKKEIIIGKKKIEFLKIERKYNYQDRDDRYSPEYTKYVLNANGKKFVVTEEQYLTADISDYIEVHKSFVREIELKRKIKKNSP